MPPLEESAPLSAKTRALFCAAITLCFWIRIWRFPDASATPLPDPSFMQGLGYALLHGMQFGTEIVYTYGPLGWFNATPHQRELDPIACFAWELAFKLVIATFIALAALELRSLLALVAFALVLVVPEIGNDAFFFLAITAISAWAIPRASRHWALMIAPLAVLVVIALDKFTYTMLVLVAVPCIAAASGRPARALGIAGLFAAMFVGAWWALGQSPANLPAWFATSGAMAASYSTAQSLEPRPELLAAALVVLLLGTATIGWRLALARGSPLAERRPLFLLSVVWFAGLVLSYKAGFTRGSGNAAWLFTYAAAAVFLVPAAPILALDPPLLVPGAAPRRPRASVFTLLRVATCIAAAVGYCAAGSFYGPPPREIVTHAGRRIAENLSTLFSLREHEAMRVEERKRLARKHGLPRIKSIVGDATVDLFGTEQGYVFLNDLNWHPRPLFQGFCVMTDALSLANERHLSGPDAPRYMLYLPDNIDYRLPCMADGRSLARMLRDYRAVSRERGIVLFERRSDAPRSVHRELVLERELEAGEKLDLSSLSGDVLQLEVEAHLDFPGRLRTLALGAPILWLLTETDDGVTGSYRVVPAMLQSGAIVRPFLESPGDWVRFLAGDRVRALKSVRFAADSSGWSTPFVVRIWRADALRPEQDAATSASLRWAMFTPMPDGFESPEPAVPTVLRRYLDVLVVQAPSALTWKLEPDVYRIHAEFGSLPEAWSKGATDGAIARVEVHRRGGERSILFERELDPARDPLDAPLMTLDLELRVEPGDEVRLTTDPGRAGNARLDLLYWANVAFTPAR